MNVSQRQEKAQGVKLFSFKPFSVVCDRNMVQGTGPAPPPHVYIYADPAASRQTQ